MSRRKEHRRRAKPEERREPLPMNPDVKRGVIAIFLFVLTLLSTLSFANFAGVVGNFFDSLLSLLFGTLKYLAPIILVWIGFTLLRRRHAEEASPARPLQALGLFILVLSLAGLIHLRLPLTENIPAAMRGEAGGLVGVALSWPLLFSIGFWGALISITALLIVSLILFFNTPLSRVLELLRNMGAMLPRRVPKIHGAYEVGTDDERGFASRELKEEDIEGVEDIEEVEEPAAKETSGVEETTEEARPRKKYTKGLPGIDLLFSSKSKPTAGDIKANAQIIQDTLAQFGIPVEMGEIRVGPTVTQYALRPAQGVKLARLVSLHNDLALALSAHPIRIEAPIPGKPYVGIEVPNQQVALVTLRELLEAEEFKGRINPMQLALGKDVSGKVWFADLTRMPHLLIAGATGSGKTVCINTIILSLLFQNTPETLRLILVDPKRVELPLYNGIPHLLTPVITDVNRTVNALKWTIGEMDRRFELLARSRRRDIHSYNRVANEPLPYIVFIIDELADLMATSAAEVEGGIIRLAQMARAVGIHLILATQRPSVDVITGLIKANIPSRIAFSVASIIDSRTILDASGAEKLLGRGDMLYASAELAKPKRIQGAYVSEDELKRVVDFFKEDEPPAYDDAITEKHHGSVTIFGERERGAERDSLFGDAKRVVLESGKASASLLQRRLKLGYARAARIIDELEEAGVIGPGEGAKPREILLKGADGAIMDSNDPMDDAANEEEAAYSDLVADAEEEEMEDERSQ